MKRFYSVFNFTILLVVISFFSCDKSEVVTDENIQTTNQSFNSLNSSKVRFYIYYSTWDEWGRKKKDCKGWGLCNYTDCWFCCIDDYSDQVVDCENSQRIENVGIVTIDTETDTGHMVIELDPSISIQNDAIVNQKILYIDYDIVTDNSVVHADDYLFDPNVGSYGGYILNVTQLRY